MKTCSYCGKENEDTATQCHGCGTPLTDHQQATTAPAAAGLCPLCGKSDGYEAAVRVKRSFSWVVFILGGYIIAALLNVSRKTRVKCNSCDGFFYIRTGASKLFLVILLIVIALSLLGWFAALIG